MKIKVTKKAIMENFKTIISAGYCECDYLLKNTTPMYYTERVYGWNSDIYILDSDTVIVTGYRPFGTDSFRDLIKKYNSKAQEINKRPETWATIQKRLDINLIDFLEELKGVR